MRRIGCSEVATPHAAQQPPRRLEVVDRTRETPDQRAPLPGRHRRDLLVSQHSAIFPEGRLLGSAPERDSRLFVQTAG